jgi:hypothetical protein
MSIWKGIGIALLSLLVIFLIIFVLNEFEIFGVKFWGVRKANVQREVFEQSQSYVEGKRQDLIKYHHEWVNADSSSKKIIENTIRNSFSQFDENQIKDTELYDFLKRIKYN